MCRVARHDGCVKEAKNAVSSRERRDGANIEPYESDAEYVNDYLKWFEARRRARGAAPSPGAAARDEAAPAARGNAARASRGNAVEAARDEAVRAALAEAAREAGRRGRRIAARLAAGRAAGAPEPRAERLAAERGLTPFEKEVLVFAAGLSSVRAFGKAVGLRRSASVGDLLDALCAGAEDEIACRLAFRRGAPLLREGLIELGGGCRADGLDADVRLDRAVADLILGCEDEDGSCSEEGRLYAPRIDLDRVVLPAEDRALLERIARHYPAFLDGCRAPGVADAFGGALGMILLFHGPAGTGKTMLANALATKLGKRVMPADVPLFGPRAGEDSLRRLLREARLRDAVVFFDDCESSFSADAERRVPRSVLAELERHDGLIILAARRPEAVDEALRRRITVSVGLRLPDVGQREAIWRGLLPAGIEIDGGVDPRRLAERYELAGGQIKDAVRAALSRALLRDPARPLANEEDLEAGARLQELESEAPAERAAITTPRRGFSSLVLPPELEASLRDIADFARSRGAMAADWGFDELLLGGAGIAALFHGAPGTGKTLAAEALAFELGRPFRVVNAAQVVSKWVGEGAKQIAALFRAARAEGAVLLFDEADALFARRVAVQSGADREANLESGVLLREVERYPGVVLLTTNLASNIDPAFLRRMRFVLEFPQPDAAARLLLWRRLLPAKTPLAADVDLARLAARHPLTGARIRNAVLKAASRAVARGRAALSMADLEQAAREESQGDLRRRPIGINPADAA